MKHLQHAIFLVSDWRGRLNKSYISSNHWVIEPDGYYRKQPSQLNIISLWATALDSTII